MRTEEAILDAWSAVSQDGLFWVDADRQIRRINHAAVYLLDLPGTPASWLQRPIWDLIRVVRQTAPAIVDGLVAEIEHPDYDGKQEREGTLSNGRRTIHWRSAPVLEDSQVVGHLVLLRDVTESRVLHEMRTDMIELLLHSLQGPLEHLSTTLRALAEEIPATSNHHNAHIHSLVRAHETTNTALSTLEEFVEISQLKSGILPLSPSVFSFHELAETVLRSAQALADRRNLSLEDRVSRDLPMIWGDRDLIHRVLCHLVTVALEASASGNGIAIQADVVPEEHDRIRVSVGEVRQGSAVRESSSVYAACLRRESPAPEPCGVDLTFCQTVLAAHGERIWVAHRPDTGTQVVFTLPQVSEALQQVQTYGGGSAGRRP